MENNKKEQIEKIRKILESHKEEIERFKLKNQKNKIQGPMIGFKMKDAKPTDEIAIIFYVDKKKDSNELGIPKEIEGIPTDIVEIPGDFKLRNLNSSNQEDK